MAFKSKSIPVWRLRRGLDRRFRAGHPWVYSNELMESPKGIEAGDLVELQDAGGKFLARGFGNPKSLIAFRVLSRDPEVERPDSVENVVQTLERASQLRLVLGFGEVSHRLCFGEVDQLPGFVMDRFVTDFGQVLVVQAHSAGANRLMSQGVEIIETFVKKTQGVASWAKTAVVLRNDLSVRKLEGLSEEGPIVLRAAGEVNLALAQIQVKSISPEKAAQPLLFDVDLFQGQKTGFFLDQFANIQLTAQRLGKLDFRLSQGSSASRTSRIRILDLCCYVGQWGAQLSRFFKSEGYPVDVVAVDASTTALERAKKNIEAQGASCETLKADVLKELGQFSDQSFDWVISDPPALIQSRKDIPQGSHAYLQLNTEVFRVLKRGGGVVCCSCSALLDEESFTQILAKAVRRNGASVRWVARGGAAPDHPMALEFPEGRYLKSWIGVKV